MYKRQAWGRSEVTGGLTDVKQLASKGLDVCVLNASAGYYAPHTDNEYIKIDELIMTLYLFRDIINACYKDGQRWVFKRKEPVQTTYDYGRNSYYYQKPSGYSSGGSKYEWYKTKGGVWASRKIEEIEEEPAKKKECRFCNFPFDYSYQQYCHNCGSWQDDEFQW